MDRDENRIDDRADALYGLPLDEFTAGRNQLARQLRNEGRREEAATVAALRKPSLAAWTVNQLARERREEMMELLRAAEAIKAGTADAYERFRAAVDDLTRAARDVLSDAGRRATDAVLQEVATTVRTGAAERPEELAAGRLTEELEASGFSAALAGARPARASRKPAEGERRRANQAEIAEAREALASARTESRRLRREATAAEREAAQARREAEQAEAGVTEAERRLAKVRGR